ncbi:BspA family leucine-rich repeat surface protein, partial [Limosilactobacillus vaginalis]|uniref:BspA family leucine-rich repeat surface protein n=1 Tax=Limosilactobacillus vaginalis TaxID=1633 RepID=UPI0033652022
MPKEHKKLYKAGKNWIVATLTATTITLLGGIGAYTVHADTTIESSQDVQTTSVNQTNQVDNSNDSVTINQPVALQSSQTAQNNQVNQNNINTITAVAATNNSDSLDSNIYGTVNVKDWDYQNDSNTFNLTSYHGQDTRHIIVPNLNDFDNAGVKIGNATGVGISSKLAKSLASRSIAFAISKTSGNYNNKVIATDQDWSWVFSDTGLIDVDVSNLDTRNITDMSGLFEGSYKLKTVGDLSQWNTSNVTDMSCLFSFFYGNSQLNNVGDLGKWDTRSVTDMSDMFKGSSIVLGNIGNWNVSNVKDMSFMFSSYVGDIGDLSHWDTSNVTNMSNMFSFSSPSVSGLTHWNTKNVRNMFEMFDTPSPYKIVASDASAVIPNQVTLKDNTGKVLAIIDTPTIYDSNKSVRSTIDGIVQAEIDKLNKLNHTLYETPKIISDGDDDYSIANATYVVNESKTGLINYVDQDGKVVKTDQISGKVGDKVDVKISLPDGYELANKDEQVPSVITVTENGIKPITIQVKKLPVVQTGSINYIDQDGKVIKTDTISGKVGDQINVNLSLPDGYELANKDEQIPSSITVGEDGIKTITIQVKKLPVVQTGSINYVDQDGKVIKTDQISGKVGDKVDVKLSLPDGYELANKDEQVPSTITVGDDGIKTININIKKINTTPTTPVNPTEPNNPTTPVNPTTPANPTEPINPSTPSDTHNNNHGTTPATPTTPMAPTAKGNPGANQPSDNNVTGWRNSSDGNHYVYYKDNQPLAGRRYVSLPTINGVGTSWYLVDNGVVQSGVQKWAGTYYYFDPVTYLKVTNDYRQSQWGDWYLFGNDGRILTGVQKWAGSYYYFDPVTYLKVTNDYRQSQWGSWYLFGNDGRILTGVQKW